MSSRTPLRRPATLAAVAVLAMAALAGGCSSDGGSAAPASTAPSASVATTTSEASGPSVPDEPVELPADRPIHVRVPDGMDPSEPAPLVVLLHGFGVSGEVQDAYLQLGDAAAQRGMLFVAPDGTENRGGQRFWNATPACCGLGSDVDDIGYLTDVIAKVRQDHAVDPDRIYLVGHSNGGFMSFAMACARADTIAAIASIEAATFDDPAACDPSEPVAVLQVHGTADTTIAYGGGTIAGEPYPSAPDTLAMWAAYDGCDPEPDPSKPEPRQILADLPPAEVTVHHDSCEPGGHVELWTQPDGVHIPRFTDDFSGQVLDWLLEHPRS